MEFNLIGRKCGLALLRSSKVDLKFVNYSAFYIYALVKETESQVKSFILGFYGRLETRDRYLSWEFLNRVNEHNDIPWCVI